VNGYRNGNVSKQVAPIHRAVANIPTQIRIPRQNPDRILAHGQKRGSVPLLPQADEIAKAGQVGKGGIVGLEARGSED
jgi:hypothetical protein